MIRHPKIGQRVRLHYGKREKGVEHLEGQEGIVSNASQGPGPQNVMVYLDDGGYVIVPRANLVAKETSDADKA